MPGGLMGLQARVGLEMSLLGGRVLGTRDAVRGTPEIPCALDAIKAAQPQPSRPLSVFLVPLSDPRAPSCPVTSGAQPHAQSLPSLVRSLPGCCDREMSWHPRPASSPSDHAHPARLQGLRSHPVRGEGTRQQERSPAGHSGLGRSDRARQESRTGSQPRCWP